LSLPNGGHSEDVIRTKPFEDYIQDHIVSWFTWAQKNKLGIDMEDLILVTGCTLATSWAVATFMENNMDPEAEVSLTSRMLSKGGTDFIWSKIQGPVVYHHSHFDAVRFLGYVYSAYTDFCLFYMERKIHPWLGSRILRLGINASSSGAFVQSASSSLADESKLQQNPSLTILTTAETTRYK
jgi:hypothetical protein